MEFFFNAPLAKLNQNPNKKKIDISLNLTFFTSEWKGYIFTTFRKPSETETEERASGESVSCFPETLSFWPCIRLL